MWRNETLDDEGRQLQDEERHCGAWTQFYFDEQGYGNGTIESLYCSMWMYTEFPATSPGAGPQVGYGSDNAYDVVSYDGNLTINFTQAWPRNATYHNLIIYWNQSTNSDFTNQSEFWWHYFKGNGKLVQMMSFPSQRSYCIINDINGSSLSDSVALNLTDYDGDGLTDYQELNVTFTNPYDQDTDDDNHDDYTEYIQGKDGWNPYDWGEIHKIHLDGTDHKAYVKMVNVSKDMPILEDVYSTLDRELTTNEYANLSAHDSQCPLTGGNCTNSVVFPYDGGNSTHNWSLVQINIVYNVSKEISNISNLINLNHFFGGILVSADLGDSDFSNKSIETWNFNNSSAHAKATPKVGHTLGFYQRQIHNNFDHYYNESDGTLRIRIYTYNRKSTSTVEFGWSELWLVTGESEINITKPLNSSRETVNASDTLTVNFTFQEEGEEIIIGVSVTNISMHGYLCELNGTAQYIDEVWQQNCTVPNLPTTGLYNVTIVASTSSSGFLTDTEPTAINFTKQDTCTYPGSGNWEVECSDNCVITSPVDMGGNNLILNGTGVFVVNAAIYDIGFIQKDKNCKFIKLFNILVS